MKYTLNNDKHIQLLNFCPKHPHTLNGKMANPSIINMNDNISLSNSNPTNRIKQAKLNIITEIDRITNLTKCKGKHIDNIINIS